MASLRDKVRASKFYRRSRQLQSAFALWFAVTILASIVLVVFGFGFLTATRDVEFVFQQRVLADPERTLATYQEFFADLFAQWEVIRKNYPPTSHLITTVALAAIGIPALFYFLIKKTRGAPIEEKFAGSPALAEKLRKWATERPLFDRIFFVDASHASAVGGSLFINIGSISQFINDEKSGLARDTLLFTAVHEYVHHRSYDNLIYSLAAFIAMLAVASAVTFFLTPAVLLSALVIPSLAEDVLSTTGAQVLAAILGLLVVVLIGVSSVRTVRGYGAVREALADGAAVEVVGSASAPYFPADPSKGRSRGIFAGFARDPDVFDRQAQLAGRSPWTDAAIAGMATTWIVLRSALLIAVPGWASGPWMYVFDIASLATIAFVISLAPPDATRGRVTWAPSHAAARRHSGGYSGGRLRDRPPGAEPPARPASFLGLAHRLRRRSCLDRCSGSASAGDPPRSPRLRVWLRPPRARPTFKLAPGIACGRGGSRLCLAGRGRRLCRSKRFWRAGAYHPGDHRGSALPTR